MVTAGRLSRQLAALGKQRSDTIVSVAAGIDHAISTSALQHFLGPDLFPALAALYGTARQVVTDLVNDPEVDQEDRAQGVATLEEMDRVFEMAQTAEPPRPSMPAAPETMSPETEAFFNALFGSPTGPAN